MDTYEEFRDDSPRGVPVHGFLHRSPGTKYDWLVLTHGAGSNCKAPLLVALADHFSASGLTVLRCDLPFRQMRPHGPPPRGSAERDQQGLAAAVAVVRRQSSGRVFLGGYSYGGRQASMLAADQPGLVDVEVDYLTEDPRAYEYSVNGGPRLSVALERERAIV